MGEDSEDLNELANLHISGENVKILKHFELFNFRFVDQKTESHTIRGATKRRRLNWLTNSALVYEPKCRGGMRGSQPISTAVHMEP